MEPLRKLTNKDSGSCFKLTTFIYYKAFGDNTLKRSEAGERVYKFLEVLPNGHACVLDPHKKMVCIDASWLNYAERVQ